MRVAGTDVRGDELPWWYVPAWLGAQLPLLTLVAVVGGLAVLIVSLIRRRSLVSAGATIALVPIVLQAVVLPLAIAPRRRGDLRRSPSPALHRPCADCDTGDGARGARHRAGEHRSRLSIVLPLGAIVIVAASLCASIRWAPYAYAFVNPIAGANKDGRSWDLDYWGVSAKEGVEASAGTRILAGPCGAVGVGGNSIRRGRGTDRRRRHAPASTSFSVGTELRTSDAPSSSRSSGTVTCSVRAPAARLERRDESGSIGSSPRREQRGASNLAVGVLAVVCVTHALTRPRCSSSARPRNGTSGCRRASASGRWSHPRTTSPRAPARPDRRKAGTRRPNPSGSARAPA